MGATPLLDPFPSLCHWLWGNCLAGWCSSAAVGMAGGILLIWNSGYFIARDQWSGVFSKSVLLEELASNSVWLVTELNGPTDRRLRDSFWEELDATRSNCSGPWCLRRDWNVISFPYEKLGGNRMSTKYRYVWVFGLDQQAFSNRSSIRRC